VSRADICGHTDRHEEANGHFALLVRTGPTVKAFHAFTRSDPRLTVRELEEDVLISTES
jgi:hypothetical protein